MELTGAQQQVVDHEGGPLRVRGGPGTGKTTALRHRYLRLAAQHGAGAVLVLAPTAAAARRFRDSVLPDLRGGWDALPITSPWGVAFDLVQRHGSGARLLPHAEQWALVHDLLDRGQRMPGYVDEVADAVQALRASFLGEEEIRTHAEAAGLGERWEALIEFATRYERKLSERDAVDAAGLLVEAVGLLRDASVARATRERFAAVLVDDYQQATFATNRLLTLLTGPGAPVTIAGDPSIARGGEPGTSARYFAALDRRFDLAADIELDRPFRAPEAPALVTCNHPALEADAAAAVLRAAHERGVAWSAMAVLVRSPARRARSLARALTRHGIPVAPIAADVLAEPAPRAIVDMLRWVDGDERAAARVARSPLATASGDAAVLQGLHDEAVAANAGGASPADLAWLLWERCLATLVHNPDSGPADPVRERALDTVVAFLDGIDAWAEGNPGATLTTYLAGIGAPEGEPDPWRLVQADIADAVTISSISGALGREWHTVVVAGCVEGELPHISGPVRWFDRALLSGPDVPTIAQRRLASLDDERRLFALACSRATGELVATAARTPGVLTSRFVAAWTARDAPPPFDDRPVPPPPALTTGAEPVWPDGRLVLSASQLSTWDDCRLKYLFSHVLHARGASTVWADFGTLVHDILATFLDPKLGNERSFDRLLEIAEEKWRDDVAPYRPQREQVRRELYDVLDKWWSLEGEGPLAPDVVDVERPVHVDLPPHAVRGFVDRIDRAPGGGLEVVDYKTSKRPLSMEDAVDDLQLAIYHLCVSADDELAHYGPVQRLRLLYLRQPTAVEQPVTHDHAARTEARIRELADEILTEDFFPSVDADCRLCDYHRLCPLQQPGREVGDG